MSSFKKLSKSDISFSPYVANKGWTYSFIDAPSSGSITIFQGKNITGSFRLNEPTTSLGKYQRLVYNSMNHLFYQEYSGSLNTSSLASSLYYESASQQRPTNSYFIYNESPAHISRFPTASNSTIQVLTVGKDVFGSKIHPGTFQISSSIYLIKDDQNGNLFNYLPIIPHHVGNIFYSQGIAVITNQSYQNIFLSSSFVSGSSGSFSDDYSSSFDI